MRALTILQPWAWLIIHGGKTIENRGWTTRYRGRLLIHASARCTLDEVYSARLFVQRELGVDEALKMPDVQGGALQLGGIIGAVTLVDVLPPTKTANPWHVPGKFGFVLADPEPLPFHRAKGALSFWGNFAIRDGKVTPA